MKLKQFTKTGLKFTNKKKKKKRETEYRKLSIEPPLQIIKFLLKFKFICVYIFFFSSFILITQNTNIILHY